MTDDDIEQTVTSLMGLTDSNAVFAVADRIAGALAGQPNNVALYALILALLEFAERSGKASSLARADVLAAAVRLLGRLVELDTPRRPEAVQ